MNKSPMSRARPFNDILKQLQYEFQSGHGALSLVLVILLGSFLLFSSFVGGMVGLLINAPMLGLFTMIVIGQVFIPLGPQAAEVLPQTLGFLFSRALPRTSVCRARCLIVFLLLSLPILMIHARAHVSPHLAWQTPKTPIPGFEKPAEAYQTAFGEDCSVTVPVDPASPIRLQIRNGKPALTSMLFSLQVIFMGLAQWIATRLTRGRHVIFWIYLCGVIGIPALLILAFRFNLLETAFLIHTLHPWLCLAGALLIYAAFHRATERRFCQLEL